jgi:hypothetical protein
VRSEKVDIEEIASTKSEKALAVFLAIFLSIGAIWGYTRIDNAVRSAISLPRNATAAHARLALDIAVRQNEIARSEIAQAQSNLVFVRESYRTALEAGQSPSTRKTPRSPSGAVRIVPGTGQSISVLARQYRSANAAFLRARANQHRAAGALGRARAAYARVAGPFSKRVDRANRERTLTTLGFRVLLAAAFIGLGYWLLAALRRRRSRYLPLAFSAIATGTLLTFVGATDYTSEYVGLRDLGPIVLSLFGIAVTMAAFVALQRYLGRLVPSRRVRKGECPFCGYPSRGGAHCEGCGREVIGECSSCGKQRRVGTTFCAKCGQA